ncbi:MAG: amidohydrolase [Candidatus Micrarchaeota archaeon]|nr:amidohydrolase [Candidatus Micrarchaeota archaeon]
MELLLENGLVLSSSRPYRFKRQHILISQGKIKKISQYKISANATKIDCSTKAILPAFINAHTHSPMSILRGLGEDKNLFVWLEKFIWPAEKKLSKEDVYWGSLLSIIEMIRSGTGAFNEHYFFIDSIAKAALKMKIRCVLGYSMIDLGDFDFKGAKELEQAEKDIQLILSYNSSLLKPSVNPHAPHTCSEKLLLNSAALAKKYNIILHTHLSETKKEQAFIKRKYKLSPAALLAKTGCLTNKTILAHSIYCNREDISLIKKYGSSIAHCPVANFKLGSGLVCPIISFLKNKINVAIGTDGPASNNSLNLLESAKFAALVQKNLYQKPEVISADDIFYMLTEGGAKALGINSGSIEEGKNADLVFFDISSPELSPFSNSISWIIYSSSCFSISDLMVAGEFLMQNKKVLNIDQDLVIKKANQIRQKLSPF